MAGSTFSLARATHKALAPQPVTPGLAEGVPARVHFWRGASGRRYGHAVYSLIECPPLPNSNYLLVRRTSHGRRDVLHIDRCSKNAPTLNLARLRQRGAQLGANEVHVHLLADGEEQRRLVACDLRAGLFKALGAEPSHA